MPRAAIQPFGRSLRGTVHTSSGVPWRLVARAARAVCGVLLEAHDDQFQSIREKSAPRAKTEKFRYRGRRAGRHAWVQSVNLPGRRWWRNGRWLLPAAHLLRRRRCNLEGALARVALQKRRGVPRRFRHEEWG